MKADRWGQASWWGCLGRAERPEAAAEALWAPARHVHRNRGRWPCHGVDLGAVFLPETPVPLCRVRGCSLSEAERP